MTYTDVGFSHKLGFTTTVLTPKFLLFLVVVTWAVFCIFLPYFVACSMYLWLQTSLSFSRKQSDETSREEVGNDERNGSNMAFRPLLVENHSGLILSQFSALDDFTRDRSRKAVWTLWLEHLPAAEILNQLYNFKILKNLRALNLWNLVFLIILCVTPHCSGLVPLQVKKRRT